MSHPSTFPAIPAPKKNPPTPHAFKSVTFEQIQLLPNPIIAEPEANEFLEFQDVEEFDRRKNRIDEFLMDAVARTDEEHARFNNLISSYIDYLHRKNVLSAGPWSPLPASDPSLTDEQKIAALNEFAENRAKETKAALKSNAERLKEQYTRMKERQIKMEKAKRNMARPGVLNVMQAPAFMVFNTPELLVAMLQYLPPRDLLNWLVTNSNVHFFCFNHVPITLPFRPNSGKYVASETLSRHRSSLMSWRHVREIDLMNPSLDAKESALLRNMIDNSLEPVVLVRPAPVLHGDTEFAPLLNFHLCGKLIIDWGTFFNALQDVPDEVFSQYVEHLKFVSSLKIQFDTQNDEEQNTLEANRMQTLFSSMNLRSLHFEQWEGSDMEEIDTEPPHVECIPRIESIVHEILQFTPDIERLQSKFMSTQIWDDISQRKQLKHLKLFGSHDTPLDLSSCELQLETFDGPDVNFTGGILRVRKVRLNKYYYQTTDMTPNDAHDEALDDVHPSVDRQNVEEVEIFHWDLLNSEYAILHDILQEYPIKKMTLHIRTSIIAKWAVVQLYNFLHKLPSSIGIDFRFIKVNSTPNCFFMALTKAIVQHLVSPERFTCCGDPLIHLSTDTSLKGYCPICGAVQESYHACVRYYKSHESFLAGPLSRLLQDSGQDRINELVRDAIVEIEQEVIASTSRKRKSPDEGFTPEIEQKRKALRTNDAEEST